MLDLLTLPENQDYNTINLKYRQELPIREKQP